MGDTCNCRADLDSTMIRPGTEPVQDVRWTRIRTDEQAALNVLGLEE